jgi:tRNA G46 methylase TrmB
VVTDVKELHEWQIAHLDDHPAFERVPAEEEQADLCFTLIFNESEEACKVARNEGSKWGAIYRRLTLEQAAARLAKSA